jgi:phage baseplate assembly protein V
MIATIQKMLAPIQRRVALMVNRCVITLVNDSLKMQGLQVNLMADVTRDGVERFQEYGFTSYPHAGAEGVMVSVGGNQDHGIVIAVDDRRYRLTGMLEGEVALYDDLGKAVHLKRTGIVVDGGGSPVQVTNAPAIDLDSPVVNTTGDLNVGGHIVAQGEVTDNAATVPKTMSGMRNAHNVHDHATSVGPPTVDM